MNLYIYETAARAKQKEIERNSRYTYHREELLICPGRLRTRYLRFINYLWHLIRPQRKKKKRKTLYTGII